MAFAYSPSTALTSRPICLNILSELCHNMGMQASDCRCHGRSDREYQVI